MWPRSREGDLRRGQRLHGHLFQVCDRLQTHGKAKQIVHDTLCRLLRQLMGAGAQRGDRLHAWTKLSRGHLSRPRLPCHLTTGRADYAVQLMLSDARSDRWQYGHLMPLGLGICPIQRVVAVLALRGLERE
jgi:hypothetical protein